MRLTGARTKREVVDIALRRLVQMRLDKKIQRRVDVSDIVQDVLLEANRRLQTYLAEPKMPFHLWLRHMARDRIIDAHVHIGRNHLPMENVQGVLDKAGSEVVGGVAVVRYGDNPLAAIERVKENIIMFKRFGGVF